MKQVIVVNRSLSLPKGKLAAQVAHAAVGAFVAASAQAQMAWLQVGIPKIVVYASDSAPRPEAPAARLPCGRRQWICPHVGGGINAVGWRLSRVRHVDQAYP
jgi:hypothetical protein